MVTTVHRVSSALTDYFLYDHLRADGFMVRWTRLDMVSTAISPMFLLCWLMEALFAVAYFTKHTKTASVGFWVAYLAINLMV